MQVTAKWATAAIVVAAALTACESDDAPESVATTTTVASLETSAATDSTTTLFSATSADATSASTVSTTAPAASGTTVDLSTTTPPTISAPGPTDGQATLVINAGAESMTGTGGTCSVIDGYTYVFVGEVGGINASLSWQTDDPSLGQFLAWQHGASTDTSYISTHGLDQVGIEITFGDGGTSGEFTGWYYVVEPQEFREFSGSFNCIGG